MAYLDIRLSDDVSFGFRGGPEYRNDVDDMDNGGEQVNARWLYPKHKYEATYGHFNKVQKDELLAAVHVCGGRGHAFRFKDHNDYEAVNEPLAPVVGTTNPVQLIRTYLWGGLTRTRLIQAPVSAVVTRNGVTTVAGTLDTGWGLFTPDSAWVAGTHAWTGEHDVWVRFLDDYNELTAHRPGGWTGRVGLLERRRR